jgi:hypothetical protein
MRQIRYRLLPELATHSRPSKRLGNNPEDMTHLHSSRKWS